MASIKFSPGSLYIASPNEFFEPIGVKIEPFEVEEPCKYADDMIYISSFNTTASFECTAKMSREAMMILWGIREVVLKHCLNKRVVHLARHAKKPRTRKKNFNRAIRFLEKEG